MNRWDESCDRRGHSVGLLPWFGDFPNIDGGENFCLDERELFNEVFHVDTCAAETGHRVNRLAEVNPVKARNDCGNFSANSDQHRVNDALESKLYVLNETCVLAKSS